MDRDHAERFDRARIASHLRRDIVAGANAFDEHHVAA
jgi:hypothetical protein